MSFLEILQEYYEKLPNPSIITTVWKEIISGKRSMVTLDQIIEYSFHHPIDTEVYLEELVRKFDNSFKESLRTIDGSFKAYFLTFLYYCIGSERIPVRTSLFAAELYLKIILLPSDIAKLYYERNMYGLVLILLNKCNKKKNVPTVQLQSVLQLTFKRVSEHDDPFVMVQGTANVYANIIKSRAAEGNIKQIDDPLVQFCLKSLTDLINTKEHPKEIKYVMESMLRCLRSDLSKNMSSEQRRLAINVSKKFIKNIMFVEVEDKNKLQYFLDALFAIFGSPHMDYYEDCVDIINMLDEQLYKELLRRIPNYLESKNHDPRNFMEMIYYLLKNPHPGGFQKLDVLYSVCFKNIVIHLLNKKREPQCRAIEVLAKICLLEGNLIMDRIFEVVNQTGVLVSLDITSIMKAVVRILNDQYAGHTGRGKDILHILSKLLRTISKVDNDLSTQALFLICKDGTPFSIKNILPTLHNLYLQLSDKRTKFARDAIMRIFFKMAMHSDASASDFIEHLYTCSIFMSTVDGKQYGPEQYSNMLFSDEFDYELFLAKSRHLIKYEHVYHIIEHFNFREPGYYVLLSSLLDYVKYKEYNILTDHLIRHFPQIIRVHVAGHLLNSYKRIMVNKGVYHRADWPKFTLILNLLWESLFKQTCGITCIRPTFDLIDLFKEILNFEGYEEKKSRLMELVSESAYRSLKHNQSYSGSVMQLTELCIVLRRAPPDQIFTIFENVLDDPRTLNLITTRYKDMLLQLLSFFGTMAMMKRSKIPTAVKLFKRGLEVDDPTVQLTAIKMYYTLCTEMTHEFDEIIQFCFAHVTSDHTVLSRVCITILEEQIHDSYILLNSEDFMRFIHRLASHSLSHFMKHTLDERFLLSNKHDIGRFFINTLVYMSGHTKLENYPIEHSFRQDLTVMRSLIDDPNDLINFLFSCLQLNTKFNILKEMCSILDSLVAGKCKIDASFFVFFNYCLYTFKVMSCKADSNYKDEFYHQAMKSIEKQIFNKDPKYKGITFYGEYETEVKMCTKTLLSLLFYIQDEQRLSEHLCPVFDAATCWVDHAKPELVQYIQFENCKDFDHSLKKLVQFYKNHKERLANYLNNRERPL